MAMRLGIQNQMLSLFFFIFYNERLPLLGVINGS